MAAECSMGRPVCYCGGETDPHIYRLIRFYRDGRKARTIKKGLTLSSARLHCSDPRTRKEGEWFDGYDLLKGVPHD